MIDPADAVLRRARWQDAIDQAGEGDPTLMESLLRSDWAIPDFAREWIADRAVRLAVRRAGRPTKIGDRMLAIERRHYAAMTKDQRRAYVDHLAHEYGIDIEVLEKMLGAAVKKKTGRVSS